MNSCVLIIFSLLLLKLKTTTAKQLVGDNTNGVMNKCLDKERHALLHFKVQLQDPSDTLSSWTADDHECCKWRGVSCNNQTGHVTDLDIPMYDLEGEISHSLVNLTYLNHLALSFNSFHGYIPTFIGSFTRLRYLDLSSNNLTGTIPWSIGSLTRLSYLDLSFNSLYGTIPPQFGNLTNLQELHLASVGRCRLEKVEWLSHLSHLEELEMDGISLAKANHWVDSISSLPNLSYLSLEGCELSHVMYPYTYSYLNSSSSSIQSLSLQYNNLTSSMYPWLFPLTTYNLVYLDISGNMLDGIPKYLGNMCSLETFFLFNNSAVVNLPDFLKNLSGCASLSLQELYAPGSLFTGSLSDDIQKFSSLRKLGLSDNHLNGSISEKLWELPSLLSLDVSFNNLTVTSTHHLSNFGNGSMIDLSSNSFYGPVPNVPSTVSSLNLSRNKFSGGISFICQFVDGFLTFLDLSHNSLTGQLADCLWHFQGLKVLNLGNNNLFGRLPPSIGSLIQLEVLYLYKNNFSGELPLSLKNCTSLKSLNLGDNKFSGNVPVWIGENLPGLYVLILRSNNFSGTILLQLCQLSTLHILDLSKNNLHGTIPSCLSNLTGIVQQGFSEDVGLYVYLTGGTYDFGTYVDHAMIEWQGDEREFFSNLKLLTSIDLSSNNLTGHIPLEITNLSDLIALNLSKNTLFGEIPQKIGEMRKLLTLDLSRNNLSGQIPSSMSRMSLLNDLDLSFNNLSGRIPSSTQLQSFEPSRYDGNECLCGPPLTKKCPGDVDLKVPALIGKSEGDGEEIDELLGWFYIGGGMGFATGFWIACGALLLNRRGRHAFFKFHDRFKDWVYVKVVVFIASLRKGRET